MGLDTPEGLGDAFTETPQEIPHAQADKATRRIPSEENNMENLRLAHAACNHDREYRFPDTLKFRVSEIVALTNRNSAQGGLSSAARQALRCATHPPLEPHEIAEIEHILGIQNPPGKERRRSNYAKRMLEEPLRAYHPDMPIEKR